jgi:DNA-binding transcriptional MerR regulator
MCAVGKSLHSGELARLTGVSSDTIRHYERLGILPQSPRTASGYRMYGRDSVDRIQLVQRALQLGFSLHELSEILQSRDRGDAPCNRVLKLTEEKLDSLGRRIRELRETQRYMRGLVHEWRLKLAHTRPGSKAMLLHSLTDKPVTHSKPVQNLQRRKRS